MARIVGTKRENRLTGKARHANWQSDRGKKVRHTQTKRYRGRQKERKIQKIDVIGVARVVTIKDFSCSCGRSE